MSEVSPHSPRGAIAIYALSDPQSREVRYVGRSKDPQARYRAHLREPEAINPYKYRWIRQLLDRNQAPILEILEWVYPCDWKQRERHWQLHFLANGGRLVNLRDCGDGPTYSLQTDDGLARLRAKAKELWSRPGFREEACKRSATLWTDPDYRKRQIAQRIGQGKGQKKRPEAVAKTGAGVKAAWARLRKGSRERVVSFKRGRLWDGFVDPSGNPVPPFRNLSAFCREHGLCDSKMHHVHRGKRCEHLGWTHVNGRLSQKRNFVVAACGWCGSPVRRGSAEAGKSHSGLLFCNRSHAISYRHAANRQPPDSDIPGR